MSDFGSLFENCGKFYKPGLRPIGDPLDPITPNNNDPHPGVPPDRLPLVPSIPQPGQPLYKCTELTIPCPVPYAYLPERIIRTCEQCLDPGGNPILSTVLGPAGYEDCVFRVPTCDDNSNEPPCLTEVNVCPTNKRYKCEEKTIPCDPGTRSQHPAGPTIKQVIRNCRECGPNDPDALCKYNTFDCSDGPPCITTDVYPCVSPPTASVIAGIGSQSPITGAGYKCVTEKIYCPPGTTREGQFIAVRSRFCETCNRGDPPKFGVLVPGSYTPAVPNPNSPGNIIKPAIVDPSVKVEETACQYSNVIQTCQAQCPPVVQGISTSQIDRFCIDEPVSQAPAPDPQGPGRILPVPGLGLSIPSPTDSVGASPLELLQIQEKNATVIDVNEPIVREDFEDLRNFKTPRKVYDSKLNFFEVEPDKKVSLTSNAKYPGVFKSNIDTAVSKALYLANTDLTWSEKDIFNLTDEKIQESLSDELLTAFKILRHPGGEVVGLNNFISMIRKHILTGTLDKVDHLFYINTAKKQLQQNFTLLGNAENSEYASRYSINYIVSNGEKIGERKSTEYQTAQHNRGRVLNEDIGISFNISREDGSVETVALPNEGLPLSALGVVAATTPESVGSPDHLNIGDGGGYYIHLSSTSGDLALTTSSMADKSYYLPDFKKAKVFTLNGKSLQSTIVASSVANQHEFVSGDAGASSFEPMYFGINLDSVSSSYTDDPFIEKYKASYSRITDADQIARHVNNNAQSLSTYRIGYDDPLYRYILDTSSFTLEQQDFTSYGFKDSLSSLNFNFVKNIPFAVVIVPVAGSKFNPLNVQSTLISYKESKLVRSLNFKPSMSDLIDGRSPGNLKTYNLYNEDGSTRIGLVESESVHSIGYKYDSSDYVNTFYDGDSYVSSINAVSSFGISYLMTEVIDFMASSASNNLLTWFDAFRRMPFSKFAELTYTAPEGIFEDIKEGFRQGVKFDYVVKGLGKQDSVVLPDDSKTVIKIDDRDILPTGPADEVIDSDELPTDQF